VSLIRPQWLDAVSSITLTRPPRFLKLLKRLFGEREGYWPSTEDPSIAHSLRLDLLTGCPDEAILAMAEISGLAHWKVTEQRRGTLSIRELIRRGDAIEQRLRRNQVDLPCDDELDQTPLHPNLVQQTSAVTERGAAPFPSDNVLRQICSIFRESAMLYLQTVLSNAMPGAYLANRLCYDD
jgi:Fungal specific transcription factor domain